MALIATGNNDDALDIVQDAMLKLVHKYASRNEPEWGPLFHRILQTTIRDWYRRQKVRNQWRSFLELTGMSQKSAVDKIEGGHYCDPIENARQRKAQEPMNQLANDNAMQALDTTLNGLPVRQQQAFLLRVWEGLSVEETAQAMGCSQGSVKTHYSRAVHKIRKQFLQIICLDGEVLELIGCARWVLENLLILPLSICLPFQNLLQNLYLLILIWVHLVSQMTMTT